MQPATTRLALMALTGFASLAAGLAQSPNRLTVLVDAFGQSPTLKQDWGFSALIEHRGKRILFDTGNNAESFAHNVKALNIDLTRLDFVVISHRHGDHTDGLRYLFRLNPTVRVYVPNDEYFGGPTPMGFFRQKVPSLPPHMRYFNGAVPQALPHGSPWKEGKLTRIDTLTEVAPGVTLVRNLSQTRLFGETPELSLSLRTDRGQVLVVGCSHPGIEPILASVSARRKPVHLLVGGLHWVQTPEPEIDRLVAALRDDWRVARVAPGHCTGEAGFAALLRAFGPRYDYAGLGTVLALPD